MNHLAHKFRKIEMTIHGSSCFKSIYMTGVQGLHLDAIIHGCK
jgi:hypothetical protein